MFLDLEPHEGMDCNVSNLVKTHKIKIGKSLVIFRPRALYLRRCITRKKISKAYGAYFLTHFTIGEHVVKK